MSNRVLLGRCSKTACILGMLDYQEPAGLQPQLTPLGAQQSWQQPVLKESPTTCLSTFTSRAACVFVPCLNCMLGSKGVI